MLTIWPRSHLRSPVAPQNKRQPVQGPSGVTFSAEGGSTARPRHRRGQDHTHGLTLQTHPVEPTPPPEETQVQEQLTSSTRHLPSSSVLGSLYDMAAAPPGPSVPKPIPNMRLAEKIMRVVLLLLFKASSKPFRLLLHICPHTQDTYSKTSGIMRKAMRLRGGRTAVLPPWHAQPTGSNKEARASTGKKISGHRTSLCCPPRLDPNLHFSTG